MSAAAQRPVAEHWMSRALELAARGRYSTQPNPRVGCVIVRDGEVVGEGFHERAGGPHAEIAALAAAGERARGADLFVSLEPCVHQGRTPPCTQALIGAGVRRVVAAMEDPNPKVAGKGLQALREAGIEIELGVLEPQAEALNRGFISRMRRGRPWLTLKLAMSLDGRTALGSGESRWITGPAARADVHRLRAEAGAVLTSVETVLVDDPELTVRDFSSGCDRAPDRIVLDTRLRSAPEAQVWKPGARRIALAVRPATDRLEALRALGVEVELLANSNDGHLDLPAALATLGRMEINAVLAECGPTLAGALLQAGVVDELVVYAAPSLLGHEGRALATLPGISGLDQRLRWTFVEAEPVGADLRLTLHPESA